jgi:hypothetical protein
VRKLAALKRGRNYQHHSWGNRFMKNIFVLLSASAALSFALCAHAECIYPKGPAKIPDGQTATETEMVDAMKMLKQFNQDVEAYNVCLEQEVQARIAEGGQDMKPEQVDQIKAIQSKRHNAAVDDLQSRATLFNEQVKAFKARQKS